MKTISRYNASDEKEHANGKYIKYEDVKEYLPSGLVDISDIAKIYTYLMDNKQKQVLSLKTNFDRAFDNLTSNVKFNIVVEAEVNDYNFDWFQDDDCFMNFTSETSYEISDKLSDLDDQRKEQMIALRETILGKLEKLYATMKYKGILDDRESLQLAEHIFENDFTPEVGMKLGLYSPHTN
jgi:hypothetical protein